MLYNTHGRTYKIIFYNTNYVHQRSELYLQKLLTNGKKSKNYKPQNIGVRIITLINYIIYIIIYIMLW